MPDPLKLLGRAGSTAEGIIARIPPERLADPTPCTGWNVRDVINHMANGNLRFAASITGAPGPDRGDDVLGGDPLAAFRDSLGAVLAAFAAEGALQRAYPSPFGELPGAALAMLRTAELAVHSWDLAAATGQPRDLDPDVVAAADQTMRSRPLTRGGSAPFGSEQPAPPGASAADRLAAYAGREIPAPGT
jgi:uncharacterized protein (TIGR03086 family)